MPVLSSNPSSVVSAGTWTTATNVYTSDNTYATNTGATQNTEYPFEVGGFNFSGFPSDGTLGTTTVTVEAKTGTASRAQIKVELLDGTTVLGTLALTNLTAADANYTLNATITKAQLQSANLKVRVTNKRTVSQASTTSVDYVKIDANYTQPAAKIETLTDTFDSQIDSKWSTTGTGGGATTTWEAGRAKLTTGDPGYAYLSSATTYDLVNSSIYAKVTLPATIRASSEMALRVSDPGNVNNAMMYVYDAGGFWGLKFRNRENSTDNDSGAITYDPVAHAWWRIRLLAGTFYFDTAPDGTTWTNQWYRTPASVTTFASTTAVFECGQYDAAETAVGVGYVDNVNTIPIPAGAAAITGTGTITATGGGAKVSGAAAVTGTGTITTGGKAVLSGAAAISAAGTITASGSKVDVGKVGSGTVAIPHLISPEPFTTYPVQEWAEGKVYGGYTAVFNSNGPHGVIDDSGNRVIRQQPEYVAGDTRASLSVSTTRYWNVDVTMRMKTVSQNRPTAPNTWERAWAVCAYVDNDWFYYLIVKTNGIEVGKRDPAYPGGQRFLPWYQGTNWPVGQWNKVRMRLTDVPGGTKIEIWVDDVLQQANPGTLQDYYIDTERPLNLGSIGFYNEDALVHFDDVTTAGLTGWITTSGLPRVIGTAAVVGTATIATGGLPRAAGAAAITGVATIVAVGAKPGGWPIILTGASDSVTVNPGGTQTSSITVNSKPANLADGDLMLAVVTSQALLQTAGMDLTCDSAAWQRVGPVAQTGATGKRPSGMWVMPVPTASAITPTNWTWRNPQGVSRWIVRIYRVTGADLTTWLDVAGPWSGPAGSGGSTVADFASITTGTALSLTVYHIHSNNTAAQGNAVITAPAEVTLIDRVDNVASGTASNDTLAVYTEARPTVGATGTRSFTTPTQSAFAGFQVALRPLVLVGVGYPKVWIGGAWTKKPAKVWNGSAWVQKPMKVWTGSTWKTLT